MKPRPISLGAPDAKMFQVNCEVAPTGSFHAGTDSLTVTVGQRVLRQGVEEMWDSVAVSAQREEDGRLIVRVLVFNPDWDEPLQIACISSRPQDAAGMTPLGCNLDHVAL